MRLLDRVDPRWVVLLLVPVLLAAGTAQTPPPRVGDVPVQPARQALPQLGETAELTVSAAAPGAPPVESRRVTHASRHSVADDGDGARPSARTPEERGRSALKALAYDPASLGFQIRFLPARSGELGSTNRRSRRITVYVRRDQSELVLRTTIAHELGHALDFVHGTPERRAAYRKARRLPAGPWFPCDRCNDFASPAGDFAEVFAVWLAGAGDFRSKLAGPPTRAQLRALAPLFSVPGPAAPATASPSPAPSPSPTPAPPRGLPVILDPPATRAPAR